MSDFIFIAATIVFFAICALYVHWCDTIIGPDDFPAPEGPVSEVPAPDVPAPDVAVKL
jgi:hypothetical protein